MAWLDDNPPRHQQFRCPRRESPSGVIGIHTAESFPDETGPDDGAENVARFIRDRTNYGSYHDICDSDSIITLIRASCVAYHIATFGINEHSYGISAATQAHKWNNLDDDWVDGTIRNMARAAARYARWLKRNYGRDIPARWLIARQAADRVPGFIRHSVADPERREDPGATFPANTFFAYYLEELHGTETEEPDMDATQAKQLKEVHHVLTTPINRVHSTLGEEAPPITVRQMWAYTHGWTARTGELLRALRPLIEAASSAQPLSAEQVQSIADEVNRLDAQAVAEATADELHERTAE